MKLPGFGHYMTISIECTAVREVSGVLGSLDKKLQQISKNFKVWQEISMNSLRSRLGGT